MPDAEIVNMFELNRVLRNSSEVSECLASRSSKEYTISNVNDDNGVPLVYVINYNDNAGFVIVSARKSGQPVLAFGDEGSFNPQRNEEMASEWLRCVAVKVDTLSSTDSEEARMHKLMWRTYEKSSELQSNRSTIHELENKLMDFNSYLMSHGRTLYTLTDISFKDSSKAEMLRDMPQNG